MKTHALAALNRIGTSLRPRTIRAKVTLTALLTASLIALSSLFLSVRSYRSDRIAYLFENHALQDALVAKSFAARLDREVHQDPPVTPIRPVRTPGALGLDRFPEDGERFFGKRGGRWLLITRNRTEPPQARPIDVARLVEEALSSHRSGIIVLTQSLDIVATRFSGRTRPTARTLLSIGQQVIGQNLASGQKVIESDEGIFAIGFRDLPKTNLLVVSVTPIDTVLEPLHRAVFSILAASGALLLAGMFSLLAILRSMTAPLRTLLSLFEGIARGEPLPEVAIPQDEFKPVMVGARFMESQIRIRERMLGFINDGIRMSLRLSQTASSSGPTADWLSALHRDFARLVADRGELVTFLLLEPQLLPGGGEWLEREWVCCGTELRDWIAQLQEQAHLGLHANDDQVVFWQESIAQTHAGMLSAKLIIDGRPIGLIGLALNQQGAPQELLTVLENVKRSLEGLLIERREAAYRQSKARTESELEIARQLQASASARPDVRVRGLSVQSHLRPAERVGGDWIGVNPHEARSVVNLFLADVSGHGIDSAFMTSLVAGAISVLESDFGRTAGAADALEMQSHLERCSKELNALIHSVGHGLKHMTLLAVCINIDSGEVLFINAGHRPPLIVSASGDRLMLTGQLASPPLGLEGEAMFKVNRCLLEQGGSLLCYTDGLIENLTSESGLPMTTRALSQEFCRNADHANGEARVGGAKLFLDSLIARGFKNSGSDDIAYFIARR